MAAAFHICVETGPYGGAVAQVEGRSLAAGAAAAANDIVLLGSDLAACHFRVEQLRRPFRRLRVEALDGPVLVNGRTCLVPGQWTVTPSPLRLRAGSQSFAISLPGWRGRLAGVMARLARI